MTLHIDSSRPEDTVYLEYGRRLAGTRSRLLHAIHIGNDTIVNVLTSAGGVDVNSPRHRLPPTPHHPPTPPSADVAALYTSPLLFAIEMRLAALAAEQTTAGRDPACGFGYVREGGALRNEGRPISVRHMQRRHRWRYRVGK
jgi:hypothetical protein